MKGSFVQNSSAEEWFWPVLCSVLHGYFAD